MQKEEIMINTTLSAIQIKEKLIDRITPIMKNCLATDDLLQNLEQDEMIKEMVKVLMRNYSAKELEEFSDEVLTNKIRKVLGIEVLSHLFDDLTPQEIASYEATVRNIRNKS